jgi:fumarate reductase flavoprotein subunit
MISTSLGPSAQAYGCFNGLAVNKMAVRYCNEDTSDVHAAFIQMRQPDWKVFSIWDSKYAERVTHWDPFGSYYGGPTQTIEDVVKGWEASLKTYKETFLTVKIVKANTIKALAEMLELDANILNNTVDRYNRFCKTRIDEDYFKRPGLLIPVDTKPFYAHTSTAPDLYILTGGLRTNTKMQVLDKEGQVIPGLYAVGTIVGDMFANYYSFMPSGINLGATCITFGYLTGKEIAKS